MSGEVTFEVEGLEEFQKAMAEFIDKADDSNVIRVLKKGADTFTKDLLSLPKPRSRIRAAGYTHMVDTFADRINGKEIEVGWGKYYGPMVEHGTVKMSAQPHLNPTFNRNAERYYKIMIDELWKGVNL